MAISVNTNVGSLNAMSASTQANKALETSMARLASGKRINSASDDAAGMAIASRLTSEIKGTNQAIRNAMDGQSMINTAEGAHEEITNILQRMRELAVQSASDTNSDSDRANLQSEVNQLRSEIDRIAGTTAWAGQNLLDGATADTTDLSTSHTDKKVLQLQAGSGTSSLDTISISIGSVTAAALGVGGSTSVPTIGNVVETAVHASATAVYDTDTATLTLGSNFDAGDIISMNINGTAYTLTLADDDGYDDSAQGVANQLKAEIDALGLTGVSVTANTDGITFNAGAASGTPVVTSTVTAGASSGAIAVVGAATTFSGDFSADDTYTLEINGISKTITASISDAYEDDASGLAAKMRDAFLEDITTANAAALAGSGDADDLALAGVTFTLSAGLLTAAQSSDFTVTAAEGSPVFAAGSVSASGEKITFETATYVALEDVDVVINGTSVSFQMDAAKYATTQTGMAAGLAAAINANTDLSGAGYTATSALGVVTIARDSIAVGSAATSAVSGDATLTEASGTFTVGGTIKSGDVFTLQVDGNEVAVTIATTDGYSDDTAGAAQQIAQAIEDAGIEGLSVTYNSNTATFSLEKTGALDVTSSAAALLSIEFVDAALTLVNTQRAELGAISNRLDSTVSNLTNIVDNLEAGRGRIEDADFAAESTSLAKSQILGQAATAMLAQANASKQGVLQLLQR